MPQREASIVPERLGTAALRHRQKPQPARRHARTVTEARGKEINEEIGDSDAGLAVNTSSAVAQRMAAHCQPTVDAQTSAV